MDKENVYSSTNVEQTDDTDMLAIFKLCLNQFLKHWYWFLLSAIVCLAIGWLYQQRLSRVYQRQAVMLVEGSDAGSGGGNMTRRSRSSMNTLLELNGVSVGDNLKNELFILSSMRLMDRVVDKLGLTTSYTTKQSLHPISLYGEQKPFEVIFQDQWKSKKAVGFEVKRKSANQVELSQFTNDDSGVALTVQLGETVKTPAGVLSVVRGKEFGKWDDEVITVSRLPRDMATAIYKGEISATEFDKETSLIVLACNDNNIVRADDILMTLFDTYKEDVVENKNRVALSTAKFIDERIVLIGKELSNVENQLADFKKRNQIVDMQSAAQAAVGESSAARNNSLQAETQLTVARYLGDYLNSHSNAHDLIPALNLGDASFNSQITAYNDLMSTRNRTVENSNDATPVVKDLDRQLEQMRRTIAASVANYIHTLQLRVNDARSNENMLNSKITQAPEQEKRGLDIQRQQSLKEALYTYLLNKREEVALQQAVNEANVRLVEGPLGNEVAYIFPRVKMILLVSLLIGLCIPALLIWLKLKLDVSVHTRSDVETATTIPILGEVPRLKEPTKHNLLTEIPANSPVAEAFRIMRFNMGYMAHDKQVMLVTSTTPEQGKSFVSRNLACILAAAKNRVLVIDADVRKRTMTQEFGDYHRGLITLLVDETISPADVIVTDGLAPGVDFMPAGPLPPNPSELLMQPRLEHLTDELRQQYDYIIFDSTPMFSVADASIVGRLVDTMLYVICVGVQERAFLPELQRLYTAGRFKNLNIVLNEVDAMEDTYGCTYGYGYGYGYGYDTKASSKGGKNKKRVANIVKRLR